MSTNNNTQQQDELDQIKSKIQDNLISSGNYDIINKQLKLQLYESGWYDKVSQIASRELMDHQQEVNSSNSSSSNSNKKNELTFDQLFAFVKPKAEELVPNEVKQDILNRITKYLDDIIQ